MKRPHTSILNISAIVICSLLIVFGCQRIPLETNYEVQRINLGYGPEDMVLDHDSINKRILAGCDARRDDVNRKGEIYFYDIKKDSVGIIPRINHPEKIVFHPHGMDLITINGRKYLYVINHMDDADMHHILKYELEGDTLLFKEAFLNDLYISPNDVCAYKDGSFWITNDAGKRNSMIERMLKLKRSTIVFTNIKGNCSIVADNLAYANGITYRNDLLYVSTTMQGKVFSFKIMDGALSDRKFITEIKGLDNLTWSGNNLITTSHQDFLAFIKHVKDSTNIAPSVVYKIDVQSGQKHVLYSNRGDEISAASTAILYEGNLYISQIFDPFILKVEL